MEASEPLRWGCRETTGNNLWTVCSPIYGATLTGADWGLLSDLGADIRLYGSVGRPQGKPIPPGGWGPCRCHSDTQCGVHADPELSLTSRTEVNSAHPFFENWSHFLEYKLKSALPELSPAGPMSLPLPLPRNDGTLTRRGARAVKPSNCTVLSRSSSLLLPMLSSDTPTQHNSLPSFWSNLGLIPVSDYPRGNCPYLRAGPFPSEG